MNIIRCYYISSIFNQFNGNTDILWATYTLLDIF